MSETNRKVMTPQLDDINGLIKDLEAEVRHLGTLNEAPAKNRTTNNCTIHLCYTF